jgi:putative ABC transport system permease protein
MRSRKRGQQAQVDAVRLATCDTLSEAVAGISQRPVRTAFTALGTTLGVACFVAVLGLTSTATSQVSRSFTELSATQVTINDTAPDANHRTTSNFPTDAEAKVSHLNGVVTSGLSWLAGGKSRNVATTDDPRLATPIELSVNAASPGYLTAVEPAMSSGVIFNSLHAQRRMRVALLGAGAASRLDLASVEGQPVIFIDGIPFSVIGIVGDVKRNADALLSIFIPSTTAREIYGEPKADSPAFMLIHTKLGAAQLVAKQAPVALRPDKPTVLQAVPPANPHALRDKVDRSLNGLFLMLAAITLIIGSIGIANASLIAVIERTHEIGVRRALGAKRSHILLQFLSESTMLGTLGGLIGTALGVGIVVVASLANSWTAVIVPAVAIPAPFIGSLAGLLAGTYPAIRAASIEPVAALSR